MAATDISFDTRGLVDLQRDLRRMAPAVARATTAELRLIAKDVGLLAREKAGEFSASGAKTIKWSAARGSASIYTDLYWMRFWEYGFHPGGGSTRIEGREALSGARDEKADDVMEALSDLIANTARRVGGFRP